MTDGTEYGPYGITDDDSESRSLCSLKNLSKEVKIDYSLCSGEEKDRLKKEVQQDGFSIKCIKNPSEELCKLAIQDDSYAIGCIKNPSEELCKLAVQDNEWAIQHIENPSEEVQKLAVQKEAWVIAYIENPSEEVCRLAVQQNSDAFKYIKNPSDEVHLLAAQRKGGPINRPRKPNEEEKFKHSTQPNSKNLEDSTADKLLDISLYLQDNPKFIQRLIVPAKIIDNESKRFELTVWETENGDYIYQKDTEKLYTVLDQSELQSEEGYIDRGRYKLVIHNKSKVLIHEVDLALLLKIVCENLLDIK